jgi:hypothetical protein
LSSGTAEKKLLKYTKQKHHRKPDAAGGVVEKAG